jgi:PAS domain S-box-containing protein
LPNDNSSNDFNPGFLKAILDQITDRIVVIDKDYKFRYANQRHLQICTKHLSDVIDTHVSELFGEPHFSRYLKAYLDRCFAGEYLVYETSGKIAPDLPRALDVSLAPFRNMAGSITGALITLRDDKAKQAERNLLRSVIDNIPDVIYAKDMQGRFIVKNPAGTRYTQMLNSGDTIAKTDSDFYQHPGAGRFSADEQRILQTGASILNKAEQIRDNNTGQTLWLEISKVPFRNADDEIAGIIGIGRDISLQKRNEQRWRDFSEATADWFWETDAELRFVYLSKRFQEVCSIPREKALGRTFQDLYHAELQESALFEQYIALLKQHDSFNDKVFSWNHRDGESRMLAASGKALFDEDVRFLGYRGATRDISDVFP